MRIRFYQAECGDAASIRYFGSDGLYHNMFVDAGYERTYRDVLAEEIATVAAAGEQIDLWVVSHIHDDHIGGIVSYINAVDNGEADNIVSNWWFNPPYAIRSSVGSPQDVSRAASFTQGDLLTKFLTKAGKLNRGKVTVGTTAQFAGLTLRILTPSDDSLRRLKDKYNQRSLQQFDYSMLTEISEPSAARRHDYHEKLETVWKKKFVEDASIENQSSISMLMEFNGIKVLWMADATPASLIEAIKAMGFSSLQPLEVDVVKVGHHGSSGNNSDELYSLIRCTRFLISADGQNKHCLPTKECLSRILKSTNRVPGQALEIYFTYDNSCIRQIFDVEGPNVFKELNFNVQYPKADKWVEFNF